jgi:hypothetical protein
MASINFDANTVEPAEAFDVLPKGKYLCMAVNSEIKPTKNGSGDYLELTFEVLDGNGKGRKIWERLNIRNSNKKAEEISQRQLSALCRAIGVMNLQDTDQLHNIPVMINVDIETREGYSPQNRVKGYEPAGGTAPVASSPALRTPAPAAAPAPQAAPAASSTPVWKKKAAA